MRPDQDKETDRNSETRREARAAVWPPTWARAAGLALLRIRAYYYLRAGNWDEATRLANVGLERRPNDLKLLEFRHRVFRTAGDWTAVFESYRLGERLYPNNVLLKRILGSDQLVLGQYSEALTNLQFSTDHWDLEGKYPGSLANMHARIGICHAYLQHWSAAEAALETAIRMSPWDWDAIFGQLLVKHGTGDVLRIPDFLDSLMFIHQGAFQLPYWRGHYTQYFLHDQEEAIKWYERALSRLSPTTYRKYWFPGYIACQMDAAPQFILDRYLEACAGNGNLQRFRRNALLYWCRSLGRDVDIDTLRIRTELATGHADRAEARCASALRKKQPADEAAFLLSMQAEAQAKQGKVRKAIGSAKAGLSLFPWSHQCFNALGSAQALDSNWSEAAASFQRVVEGDPFDASAWEQLGTCHRMAGRLDAASRCLESATRLDPLNGSAWVGLGVLYHGLGQPDQSRLACERGLKAGHLTEEMRLEARRIIDGGGNPVPVPRAS